MSGVVKVSLVDVGRWIRENVGASIEPLKEKARKLIKNLQRYIEDLNNNCEKLIGKSEKEMLKENRKTFRFARMASKFGREVQESLWDIKPPEEITYKSLSSFYEFLSENIKLIEQKRMLMYPRITPYFIIDRMRVDSSLKRIIEALKDLDSFLRGEFSRLKAVEDVALESEHILNLYTDLKELEGRYEELYQELSKVNEEVDKEKAKLESLKKDGRLGEIEEVKEKIRELRAKIKHALRHLRKPFKKLDNLSRTTGILMLHEREKIGEYLEDPFMALATEEKGYPILKGVLRKLNKAVSEDKLTLKSSRIKKAQDTIHKIMNKEFLLHLQLECTQILRRYQELSSSESIKELKNEMEVMEAKIRKLEGRRDILASRLAVLEREKKKTEKQIEEGEKQLERAIYKLTNQKVSIVK